MQQTANTHKPYLCVDCGAPVGRRIKRCPDCHAIALKNRPTYERTPEIRAKMSESQKAIPKPTGWNHAPETREKIAAAWTDEKREAARERGRKYAADKEWRLRIANALSGENNPRWQGGITGQKYTPGFDKTLKRSVRERDLFTCQLCGMTEDELGYRLSIHHADYDKSNHDPLNLFATCKRCNSLVNTNREVWQAYFGALAERRQLGQDVSHLITRKVITQREGFIFTEHDLPTGVT
jgi:DNA-directed RNA polymerase subunit RPC12/RpoP